MFGSVTSYILIVRNPKGSVKKANLEQNAHGLHDDLHRRGGLRKAFDLRDVVLGQAVERLEGLLEGGESHIQVGLRIRLYHLHLGCLDSDLRFLLAHLSFVCGVGGGRGGGCGGDCGGQIL